MSGQPEQTESQMDSGYSSNTFVGMIVPFFHPRLLNLLGRISFDDFLMRVYQFVPRNWIICDGQRLDGSHPRGLAQREVDPAFWGLLLPNLTERVPRGIGLSDTELARPGGTDRLTLAAHQHAVQGLSGSVANSGGDPGRHAYLARDDHRGWGGFHLRNDGDPNGSEGQHRHDIDFTSGGAGQIDASIIPSYLPLVFLIRIK